MTSSSSPLLTQRFTLDHRLYHRRSLHQSQRAQTWLSPPIVLADGTNKNNMNGKVDSDYVLHKHDTVVSYSAEKPTDRDDDTESVKCRHGFVADLGDFSQITSAHGIPHIGASNSWAGRLLWTLLVIACTGAFISQAYWVIEKFLRNERSVNIEVKYGTGYPAVTICNINPYKNSLVQEVESLRDMLLLYQRQVEEGDQQEELLRHRRANPPEAINKYEPAYEKCNCDFRTDSGSRECTRERTGSVSRKMNDECICIYDETTNAAWPCNHISDWNFTECAQCDDRGRCTNSADAMARAASKAEASGKDNASITWLPCVCKLDAEKKVTGTAASPPPTEAPENKAFSAPYKKAMGFGVMTDTVAITTKAKENLMFAMAALPLEQREALSYDKHEFIRKCSFNGEQCDIDKDFKLHVDPVYGNCYTFNYDHNRNLSSSKAGPMYGLRVMTYVNISDYLPTSDSGGVRLSIHEKTQYPFPDTFGFNAPTGFISSFGLTLKKVVRMQGGDGCVDNPVDTDMEFIYKGYEYSVEACYRSCFQNSTVEVCKCADPRFPIITGSEHCKADDPDARSCLLHLSEKGDFHKKQTNCSECRMPCNEMVIWAAFSTARWPSGAAKLGDCRGMDFEECLKDYKQHAAMVEVFLEKLSYENLKEYEAYGWVNVIADFGGQLGLWMGFSVITCMEFVMLIWHVCTSYCCPATATSRSTKRQPLDL